VAPSTFTSYRRNITHVADRIGHVRLDALDAPTLDALYADLEAGGLARSTVRLLHTQLHRALAASSRPGRPPSFVPSWPASLRIAWRPSGSSPWRQGCGSGSWRH
jgi:hypothetical protein